MLHRTLCVAAIAGVGIACSAGPAMPDAPAYTIYEIQYSDSASGWSSPHYGEIVKCTGGIVTHIFRQRFALQDPSLGTEWAAVEVRGYPVYPTGIEVGDQVDFDSVYVDEYRGATVLQYYNASSHTVNSSGHPPPEPLTVPLYNLRYPAHPEDCERYAAMLLRIEEDVTIGAMDLGNHEDNYELVGVSGDTAWASDYANTDISSTYYVSEGECYSQLTGILQRYTAEPEWDYYQFLPRRNADYVPCSGAVEEETPTDGVWLGAGHPNPFHPSTEIPYSLDRPSAVRLSVYDVRGRRVAVLVDGMRGPGVHRARWDGSDGQGRPMAAGVYLVRLVAGSWTQTAKVCLVR